MTNDTFSRALRITSIYEGVSDPDPSWVPYESLTSPEGLQELASQASASVGAISPVERSAATGLAIGQIASALAFALTGSLALGEGALVIAPGALSFRFGSDGLQAIGANSYTVAAQPEERTAAEYAQLMTPLLDGIGAFTRRGTRALWMDAGDRLATAMFYNCLALGLDDGPSRAESLLAAAPSRLQHRIRLLEVPCRGTSVTWKRRAVCCLAYQTPSHRESYCSTCPHVSPSESVTRLSTWLESR